VAEACRRTAADWHPPLVKQARAPAPHLPDQPLLAAAKQEDYEQH
jgi:hypothetical protein